MVEWIRQGFVRRFVDIATKTLPGAFKNKTEFIDRLTIIIHRRTDRQADGQTERQTGRPLGRQAVRRTDGRTVRQRDRQTG